MNHLDAETIYALLDDRVDEPRARSLRVHLWRCDRCRRLRDECAVVVGALRRYGETTPRPPAGYWSGVWSRLQVGGRDDSRPTRRRPGGILPPLAAAATVLGLLVGGWMATRPADPEETVLPVADAPAAGAIGEAEWDEQYRFFERISVGVGSVDPLSKGLVLAGMAERR